MQKTIIYIIFIILISISNFNFSQEENQNPENTQDDVRELGNEIDRTTLNDIFAIWNLNVYLYFKITKYDTPLKRKVFERSPEYKDKFEKLKKLKALLNTKEFFINISLSHRVDAAYVEEELKSKYNLNTKKFELILLARATIAGPGRQFRLPYYNAANLMPLKTISDSLWSLDIGFNNNLHVQFGLLLNIPITIINKFDIVNTKYIILYHSFPVSEEIALKIENESKVKIYFKLSDLKKIEARERDVSGFNLISFNFITHQNRIEITDTEGNLIYKKQY